MLRICGALLLTITVAQFTPAQERRDDRDDRDARSKSLINIHVSRTTQVVNYRDRASTKIDFQGTALMARAEGKADIQARNGRIAIKAEFNNLEPATTFGSAYLTYVLWAISPEGKSSNLGEIFLDGSKAKLEVTTTLQTFALIVTAEPYFTVSFPSEVVVMENVVRGDTKGSVSTVDAKFELLQRGTYDDMHLDRYLSDSKVPLSLYEARNAVRIAKAQRADRYAPESWAKAQDALRRAEDYQMRKQHKAVPTAAREAAQAAEDARNIAVRRQEDERIAERQRAADDETRRARREQEEEAQRRADADRQRMQAEVAAAQEAKARAEADAQRQAAMLQEQQAREQAAQDRDRAAQSEQQAAQAAQQAQDAQAQADRAHQLAEQSERDKQELRAKLLQQFNRILETRDTVRGLVVNIGDVLFDTARYTLRPPAREALAKLSGIVLAYPGLRLQVEGHTDSTGTQAFNQKLSEQRANSVRDYLVQQGLEADSITATGLGQDSPIADNGTAAGRQKNRRVEIIVSGEVIGTQIGPQSQPAPAPPQP
jgi:outer membrane protein OmpA-like peptidoglycan-associated protein